jgi:cathepsin L
MTAIYRQPISVAIEADQQIFQGYTGGVLTTGCGNTLDHAVLAIGYNNSASTPYVIIQNSWGTSWGANGWINLSIEGNNGEGQCGFMAQPAYPIA